MKHNRRQQYELAVIGAGAAGNKVARKAGRRGWRVALVEADRLGGTCLNYGCDPTKAIYRCAQVAHLARRAREFGIDTAPVRVDFAAVMARVRAITSAIRGPEPDGGLAADGVDLIREKARFLGPRRLRVGEGEIEAERFVVATGMSAAVPDLEGLHDVEFLTHRSIFNLTSLPRRLLIVGGGPVGVEFAQIFARLGSTVMLLEMMPSLMSTEEAEISAALAELLQRERVNVFTEAKITRFVRKDGKTAAFVRLPQGEQRFDFDRLLLAAGRRPNIENLDLETAGVEVEDGGVRVDAELRTTAPHIWACGDITGRYPFTHAAGYHADVVLDNILEDAHRRADESTVPWVIFTDPELAHVGMTEQQAVSAGHYTASATIDAARLPRARISGETFGLAKIVVDRRSERILGAHLLCHNAGEIMHELALAIRVGLPAEEVAQTIHAYPTMAQIAPGLARRAMAGNGP